MNSFRRDLPDFVFEGKRPPKEKRTKKRKRETTAVSANNVPAAKKTKMVTLPENSNAASTLTVAVTPSPSSPPNGQVSKAENSQTTTPQSPSRQTSSVPSTGTNKSKPPVLNLQEQILTTTTKPTIPKKPVTISLINNK